MIKHKKDLRERCLEATLYLPPESLFGPALMQRGNALLVFANLPQVLFDGLNVVPLNPVP